MQLTVKPSDRNTDFNTGAVRGESIGRGQPSLLPFATLEYLANFFPSVSQMPWTGLTELAKLFEAGASKYEARNWEKGIPISRYIDSAIRHYVKFIEGEMDEPHCCQYAWNVLCMHETILRDNRGDYGDSRIQDYPLGSDPYEVLIFANVVEKEESHRLSVHASASMRHLWKYLLSGDMKQLAACVSVAVYMLDRYTLIRQGELSGDFYIDLESVEGALILEQRKNGTD